MSSKWIPWSDRNMEYAPIVALHPCEPFYPTSVDSFLREKECEFWVLSHTDSKGPVFGKVKGFDNSSYSERCQMMMLPKFMNRSPSLRLHHDRRDMNASFKLQSKYPRLVYVRGFRNTSTGEAYITYWFFYMENFQPQDSNKKEIEKELKSNEGEWWTHQGDWEGISVHFSNYNSVSPREVHFSQHEVFETIPWGNVMKEKDRILAFVALGSHATYNGEFDRGHVLLWKEVTELDHDHLLHPTQNNPTDIEYVLEELDPSDPEKLWISFDGRWGKSGGGVTKAPTGPLMKNKSGFVLKADITKYQRKKSK